MQVRWPIVAFCLIAMLTLRTDGRGGGVGGGGGGGGGGMGGGGGGGRGPGPGPVGGGPVGGGPIMGGPVGGGGGIIGGGGTGSGTSRNLTIAQTLDNSMGAAVWTDANADRANSDQAPTIYKPLTKGESTKAIASLNDAAKAIDDKFHLDFKNASSTHTIIYSTAESSALSSLTSSAEMAYTSALRPFGYQSKQVVLPGKLLIYVLDKAAAYESFAKDNDNFDVPKGALGYTYFPDESSSGSGGVMHIVMGPPPEEMPDKTVKPITAWHAALVRAMTFALVDRFHTNRAVPTWVMQGLADVAADTVLPQPLNRTRAYLFSQQKDFHAIDVLNDKNTDFSMHVVMQTLNESLLTHDRSDYVKFLFTIKDGKTAPDALQASYKLTFDQLDDGWTSYVKRFANT
jgi:hypothetical protein